MAVSFFSASSLFWPIFSGLVGLAAVVVGFLGWRSNLPRRRILCNVISRTRLLTAPKSVRNDLEISFQSKTLENPYVVTAEISNVGKRAITSESFSSARGLGFQLTSPILKILTVEHEPTSAPQPLIVSNDSNFELRPELLVAGEIIRVSMLTEGPVGDVALSLNPIGDVKVATRDREKWLERRVKWGAIVASSVFVIITLTALTFSVVDVHLASSDYSGADKALAGSNCENIVSSLSDVGQSMGLLNSLVGAFKNGFGGPSGLPDSLLKNEDDIIQIQAGILSSAYIQAQRSGVPVGVYANVVTMLKRAGESVLQLEHAKNKSAINANLKIIGEADQIVNGNEGIPLSCENLLKGS